MITITGPWSSDQMEWESTSVAAARASTQKQSSANWVSEEMIKQYHEKKLCIHCGTSEHFRNNCLYHSVQQSMTSITIANTTTTTSEIITHKSDVRKVSDLKKK